MAPMVHVWVICLTSEDGEVHLIEAHVSSESAEAAVKTHHSNGSPNVEVKMLELKSDIDIDTPLEEGKVNSKKKMSKKAKKSEPEEDGEDKPDGEGSSPKKAKDIKDSRKTIPDVAGAKPDALKGLKLLFTGTMDIDRKTCEATAVMYGADVMSKVEDTDYVVLGTRPGPKKLETINKHGLDTIREDEFFEMLKTGVPKEKRERMAAKGEDEPPKKKQKN